MQVRRSHPEVAACGGFTFVELIVALLVVAVIAALAVSKMNRDPIVLSTQAEQLAGDIRYVQSLAMTRVAAAAPQARYRINFTASNYTFTKADGTAVPHPLTGSVAATSLSSNVTMAMTANLPSSLVGFDEKGTPYTDAAVSTTLNTNKAVITLTLNALNRTVEIYPDTGLVRVP